MEPFSIFFKEFCSSFDREGKSNSQTIPSAEGGMEGGKFNVFNIMGTNKRT